eukprot:355356-Chlamydomonas_euryale.AAC.2
MRAPDTLSVSIGSLEALDGFTVCWRCCCRLEPRAWMAWLCGCHIQYCLGCFGTTTRSMLTPSLSCMSYSTYPETRTFPNACVHTPSHVPTRWSMHARPQLVPGALTPPRRFRAPTSRCWTALS